MYYSKAEDLHRDGPSQVCSVPYDPLPLISVLLLCWKLPATERGEKATAVTLPALETPASRSSIDFIALSMSDRNVMKSLPPLTKKTNKRGKGTPKLFTFHLCSRFLFCK